MHNAENRLTGVGRVTTSYVFDVSHHRVKLTASGAVTETHYIGKHYEKTLNSGNTKYYFMAGQLVAFERSAGYGVDWGRRFVFRDHLGSTNIIINATSGVLLWRDRYYPFGDVRDTYRKDNNPSFSLQTQYRFTGQRLEQRLGTPEGGLDRGLYFYGSRWYDSALGRFIQADTIVPQPGNPQALNRYSYVRNSPLRYTDPTGMFSEDEIMKYLNVDTREEVLAMFAEGGQFAGRWGVLGLLRAANLGDKLDAYDGCFSVTCAKEEWGYKHAKKASGILRERDGQLLLEGSETWNFATLATSADLYHLDSANVWVGYKVYWDHVRYDWLRVERNIDWVGVGFDLGGVAADIVTFGAAGRVINAVQVANSARKVGQALDVSGAAYNLGAGAVEWYQEGRISGETARSIGYSAAGFIPGLGTLSDTTSAIDGIFYWGP